MERRVRPSGSVRRLSFENPVSNEIVFFVFNSFKSKYNSNYNDNRNLFCVSDGSGNPLWSEAQQRL
jgi:hypothetical protein